MKKRFIIEFIYLVNNLLSFIIAFCGLQNKFPFKILSISVIVDILFNS